MFLEVEKMTVTEGCACIHFMHGQKSVHVEIPQEIVNTKCHRSFHGKKHLYVPRHITSYAAEYVAKYLMGGSRDNILSLTELDVDDIISALKYLCPRI